MNSRVPRTHEPTDGFSISPDVLLVWRTLAAGGID